MAEEDVELSEFAEGEDLEKKLAALEVKENQMKAPNLPTDCCMSGCAHW